MKRVFLLRAYGDFTIFIDALNRSSLKNEYQIIASKHLELLYNAIKKYLDLNGIHIQFIDFGIQQSQFNLFTNKTLLTSDTYRQLSLLKQYLKKYPNKSGIDYLEQDKRKYLLNTFINYHFESIVNENQFVYASYRTFFQNNEELLRLEKKDNIRVLLFPDARLVKRIIPNRIIEDIQFACKKKNYSFSIARFKTKKATTDSIYMNFEELMNLISENDLIVGADSLPVHLCHLLNKQHYMLFPNNHPRQFITPFAETNEYFGEFDHYDVSFL